MPRLTRAKIRDTTPGKRDIYLRDGGTAASVIGLFLKVTPAGGRRWGFQYRGPSGVSRKMGLGSYPAIGLDKARELARECAAQVAAGMDPLEARREAARTGQSVSELADRYETEYLPRKAKHSRTNDRAALRNHILPRLGSRPVRDVTVSDVADLHQGMSSIPVAANRALALLSRLFTLAEKWGWRDPFTNPAAARFHDRFPERRTGGRSLTVKEMAALGSAIRSLPPSPAVSALRLALLTGARPAEICGLTWGDLRLSDRLAELPETKTGARRLYLGRPAVEILEALQPASPAPGDPVFPSDRVSGPIRSLRSPWERARDLAGLPAGVRLYDACRHTFISWGKDRAGIAPDRVELLAGHAQRGTIEARYTHYQAPEMLRAADRISGLIAAALDGENVEAGDVVAFPA